MPVKNILILLRHEDEDRLIEALDTALVAGVFEQSVTVLIRDRAIVAVCSPPPDSRIPELFVTLKEYGVSPIYACSRSLAEQGLTLGRADVVTLTPAEQRRLIGGQDMVVND